MATPTPETPRDPWLLTPGPLTTAPEVKSAMMRDLGSRDDAFVALSERVRVRNISPWVSVTRTGKS